MVAVCCNDTKVHAGPVEPDKEGVAYAPSLNTPEPAKERNVDLKRYEGLMPEITEQKGEFQFPVPQSLKMDEKEFEAFVKPLVETTRKLAKKLKKDLAVKGANQTDLVKRFVYELDSEVKKNPKGKAYMLAMRPKTGIDKVEPFAEVIQHIAPVLLAGGYFVDADLTGVYNEELKVIEPVGNVMAGQIRQSKLYKVSDKKGSTDARVAVLEEADVISNNEKATAFFIPSLNIVVYFKEDSAKRSTAQYDDLVKFGFNPKNVSREKMQKDYDTDTFNHEVTHIFTSTRYPNAARAFGLNTVMDLKLALPLGNGQMADLSGRMNPVNLHELCAVANELYQSRAEVPQSLYGYINKGRVLDPVSGYQLVSSALPLAAITQAPDSPQKDQLIAALSANRQIDTMEIDKLIRDTYLPDDIRALGGHLYEICMPQMELAEKQIGELIRNNPQLQ